MAWIEYTFDKTVKVAFNLDFSDINTIRVDTSDRENDENWYVFVGYKGRETLDTVFEGTQVECLRIYDRFVEGLNVEKLEAWS